MEKRGANCEANREANREAKLPAHQETLTLNNTNGHQ